MLSQGFWAEIKMGDVHLRLFSEDNAQGVQASVYNVNSKTWVTPSETVENIEDGKDVAERHAREYLKQITSLEMPVLEWKRARST